MINMNITLTYSMSRARKHWSGLHVAANAYSQKQAPEGYP